MEQLELAKIIDELGRDRVLIDEPMAQHTTYRIGGPADCFYTARSGDELLRAVQLARSLGVPYFVLGLGANILVGDRGFRGLIVQNRCTAVKFVDPNPNRLIAESGASIADLITLTKERGLSGLEHFAGIPSTVGGALWQNLHFLSPSRDGMIFIEQVLVSATLVTEEDEVVEVDKEYFGFGYDQSVLHRRRDVVIAATFELTPAKPEDIQQVIDANLRWRGEKHPNLERFPSAGSVFRQIEGLGAGRLIDQCGLKGHSIGGALVSPTHANFIVNNGGATAADVTDLIRLCKISVKQRFAVDLTEEISMVGEF